MTLFALSQALIVVAMVFDVMTFQFRERRHVVYSMVAAQVLIAAHFGLLDQWTAVLVITIAAIRNLVSLKVRSARLMWLFITLAVAVTAFTWSGPLSLLACVGSALPNLAMFSPNDRRMRKLLMVSTAIWIAHNALAGSPMATLMEVCYLAGNLVGYWRIYGRRQPAATGEQPPPTNIRQPATSPAATQMRTPVEGQDDTDA